MAEVVPLRTAPLSGSVAAEGRLRAPTASQPPRRAAADRLLGSLFVGAEWTFAAVALFLFSGAVVQLLLWEGGASISTAEGNPTLRNLSLATYLISFGFMAARWRSVASAVLRDKLHLAFVLFALLSVGWSSVPNLTLQRAVALLLTTAFGWYLGTRFSAGGLLWLVGIVYGVAMVLSLAAGLALPSFGIATEDGGAWRGVFIMKNSLGKAGALAAIALVLLSCKVSRHRWIFALGALLSCALIVLANSKTAVVLVLAILAVLPLLRVLQWHLLRAVPVAACIGALLCLAGLWLVMDFETGLQMLDRDVTLTGRVPLWEGIVAAGSQRPWLGFGYSAFWLEASEQLRAVRQYAGWRASGGHNGFLEVWLEVGLIGLLLFGGALIMATGRAFVQLRRVRSVDMLWPIAFILFYVLGNLTESGLARSNHVLWIVYIAVVTAIRKPLPASVGAAPSAGPGGHAFAARAG